MFCQGFHGPLHRIPTFIETTLNTSEVAAQPGPLGVVAVVAQPLPSAVAAEPSAVAVDPSAAAVAARFPA